MATLKYKLDDGTIINLGVGPQGVQGPKGEQGIQGPVGPQPALVNTLTSTSTSEALTANMGKSLKDSQTSHEADTVKHITATERNAWNNKSNLGLGTTPTTAYRGDYGNTAYTHSQAAHAPADANANLIEAISVNGTTQTITSKKVNITVPTNTTQLTNGSGYQTAAQVSTAISNALGEFTAIDFKVVSTLPATGLPGTFYLVANSGSGNNTYDEYVYINSKWEKLGTRDIDLSGYVQQANLIEVSNAEIDSIVG